MTRATTPLLALVLALAVTGCGGEKKQAGAGTAEGEVLPGSASDAMLPYDSVKSQAPLAPRSESEDKEAKAPQRQSAKEATTAPDAEASAATAPTAPATD